MQKYKVIDERYFVENKVPGSVGSVIEMDPEQESTKKALELKQIELVVDEPKKLIKFTVIKGPIADRKGEVFRTGNVIELEEGDELIPAFLENGNIEVPGTVHETVQSAESPLPPVEPGSSNDKEPRARYRGHIVVVDEMRTVGTQTFHHIHLDDGTALDLTEKQYKAEVHVSYPSDI